MSMYDCIIIGAGISGTSLAFELSKQCGSVLLLDKENDVACGSTKANSAILHAGYDPLPGSAMAFYNVKGNQIIPAICKDLDVPCKRVGSYIIAFDEHDLSTLQELYERGIKNGVPGLRIISQKELQEKEPNVSHQAIAALEAPSACIIDPWGLAIAYAETAVKNGVEWQANQHVTAIEKTQKGFLVHSEHQLFEGKIVVNAAGVACDQILGMLRKPAYEITPTKGEYYLLDKSQGSIVQHVIFQCPNTSGKGVLIAPTVHGNLLVGSSSSPCEEEDLSTTQAGLNFVKQAAQTSVPAIDFKENITTFAGIRARRKDHGDFIIGEDPQIMGLFHIAAMQSPGLSSASAIAIDMVKAMQQKGLFVETKQNAITSRKVIRLKEMSVEERIDFIKQHPAYGRIICRCEMISEGEIIEALHRPITPISLAGMKRRCFAGMGRCQGGFCGPKIQEIIARELHVSQEDAVQDKAGSMIVYGRSKEGGDKIR